MDFLPKVQIVKIQIDFVFYYNNFYFYGQEKVNSAEVNACI